MAVTSRTQEPWTALLDAGIADERLVREARSGTVDARLEPIPADLHPALAAALRANGIDALYTHQRQALDAAADGPFIVTTGTASGKSMCFNLPVLDVLCADPHARAIYLYPTKALAQDQARALHALRLPNVRPAIYDGDTPRNERAAIRRKANVILTNPDMLHVGILPNHQAWGNLFANLAAIVVDEAHVYRGVFGSHVGNVLRRLRRIAAAYGTSPRFFMASATIANPVELAERLTGLDDIALIDEDGSPHAARRTAIWNPPVVDPALGLRRSPLSEASDLLAELVGQGARTICFMKSRKGVEVIARSAQATLTDADPSLAGVIAPYRAGYTPAQRRELERALTEGELRGVVTTDALELGIDIGALDAAIVVTFPGTVASLRQMWGRAGRRGRGLALYIAGEDALDQFFCRHPDEFLDRAVEAAILDHESEDVHLQHLVCAAHEGPLSSSDADFLGPRWLGYAERLESQGVLRERSGTFVPRAAEDYPAAGVNLRSASADGVLIVDSASGEVVGTVDASRACSTVHDGAVYLHMGRAYEVEQLDLDQRSAVVRTFDGDWTTQPKRETDTEIEQLIDRTQVLGVQLSLGRVSVTDQVLGYQRRRQTDGELLDFAALDLPKSSFVTQALWFELPGALLNSAGTVGAGPMEGFPVEALLGSLHAAEHAMIAVLPLLAMCDRWDIGGLSTNAHPQTGCPTIFIYDGHPGGVGIARQGFREFGTLVGDAHRLISECPCRDGCPSCVQSPKCGNLNEPLSKGGARELLERMLANVN